MKILVYEADGPSAAAGRMLEVLDRIGADILRTTDPDPLEAEEISLVIFFQHCLDHGQLDRLKQRVPDARILLVCSRYGGIPISEPSFFFLSEEADAAAMEYCLNQALDVPPIVH